MVKFLFIFYSIVYRLCICEMSLLLGSFATASCTQCGHKVSAETIRPDVFEQRIPRCPICIDSTGNCFKKFVINFFDLLYEIQCIFLGIMKPDIVFFGEGLPESFHNAIEDDKNNCDLLIVIGSSLKVRPVARIPSKYTIYFN